MSSLRDSNPLRNSGALDDFQPRPKPAVNTVEKDANRAEQTAVRQDAQERGFVLNNLNATTVRARRNLNSKASKSHTLRLYIEDINRFQTWCNENHYSQARGLELLLDRMLG